MVATSSPLAAQAALWALAEGGTAVDAAIASDGVLGLVQPMSTGVGGDAFCLVDDGREVAGFNGSGAAPAALTTDACRADGAWHDTSPLTVTVPGGVDAWHRLSERYGRLGLGRVLAPARRLAEEGFPVGRRSARDWSFSTGRVRSGSPYATAPPAGGRFANPALAETLAAIAGGGPEAHYGGRWGKDAVEAVVADGGVLAQDDLTAHAGEWVAPITGVYRGHEVVELPPNGQGAAVLVALGRLDAGPPPSLAETMLAVREGMEAAHRHVADPRFAEGPRFWEQEKRDTVYTAVVAGGMAVGLISSVFMAFGSGICAGGSAVQNRGFGFSLDGDHPNVVAGGKRPFHTIIPALLRRDGRTRAVFGVIGGPMQPQGHVQVLGHLLDGGLDPQAALDRPRVFWIGDDQIAVERGHDPSAADELRAAGFDVVADSASPDWFGVGQVVRVHDDGWLEGGSDSRHDGAPLGR